MMPPIDPTRKTLTFKGYEIDRVYKRNSSVTSLTIFNINPYKDETIIGTASSFNFRIASISNSPAAYNHIRSANVLKT